MGKVQAEGPAPGPMKPTLSSPGASFTESDSESPGHTLVSPVQPGRTSWVGGSGEGLSVPPAAPELSRRRPTAPAWRSGLGTGASVGD